MNKQNVHPDPADTSPTASLLKPWTIIKTRLITLKNSSTPLYKEIFRFAWDFEFSLAPAAKEQNQSHIIIKLTPEAEIKFLRFGPVIQPPDPLKEYPNLWKFLAQAGLTTLIFNIRLENNQVSDILTYLHANKRAVFHPGKALDQPIRQKAGIHFACTKTRIHNESLIVEYSYCLLNFSKFVKWFEKIHRDFHDHRALFRAAPKYTLIVAAVTCTTPILYSIFAQNYYLLLATSIEATTIIAITYLFFLVVGSIEYDNEEATFRLELANKQLSDSLKQIKADMKRAQSIQKKLLPRMADMPFSENLKWAHYFKPREEIGGDYFDTAQIDDNSLITIFCDASGHGLSAALVTAIIKTTFQAYKDNPTEITQLIENLNTNLYRLTPADSFAAAFIAHFNIETGKLHYFNMGHAPLPLLISADAHQDPITLDQSRNLLLGVKARIETQVAVHHLQPGDTILFASDGVTDTENIDRVPFETDRLYALAASFSSCKADDLIDTLACTLKDYAAQREQTDDWTLLAMQYTAPASIPNPSGTNSESLKA